MRGRGNFRGSSRPFPSGYNFYNRPRGTTYPNRRRPFRGRPRGGPYWQGSFRNPPYNPEMPTTSTYPYPTPAESNPRQLFNASHLLCIVAITMMSLTALASAQSYQVCGTNPSANIIALPVPVNCTVSSEEPLMRMPVRLYTETDEPLRAPPTTTTQTPRPRSTQKPLPITLPERPRTAPSFSTRIPPTQAPSQSFHRVPPRPLATPSTRLPIRPPNLPVQTATLQIQTLQRPLPSSPKSTTTVSPNLSKKAREVDSYYRETYNNICNRQYLNTLRIRTFSTVEPTWAARELLQRNDVVATLQDSELFVTRCRPVHPQKIFEDHRVNDTCYVLTPVQADDAIWKSRLPYIKIYLSGKPVTALIDSGSAISCVSVSTLRSLNKSLPASSNPSIALAANGTSITLLAHVELPVIINGHAVSHNMHVLKDEECPAPALLGSDFLQRLNELGKKNIVCDTLSRHLPEVNAVTTSHDATTSYLNPLKARKEQDDCEWIRSYKEALRDNCDVPELTEYILINDMLYKLPERIYQNPRLVLPEDATLKNHLVAHVHSSNYGIAHLGIKKTSAAVSKLAIWNNMYKTIRDYVTNCKICQDRKDPNAYRVNEPLHQFETPIRPWQRVHSDVIGPLPLTLEGNKFIIVFVDAFSKYIIAEPIPDQKADTSADVFINRCVARFGTPELLVTDQGSNYMSETFKEALKVLNIVHKTSTPYHHESNGQVERANRTIQELISMATKDHPDRWDNVIHMITYAYNTSKNSTTKYSPYTVIHGCEPNNPFRAALQLPARKFVDENDYASQLTMILKNVWQDVHHNMEEAQQVQKHQYDLRKRTSPKEFKIGQKVLIRKPTGHKLAPRFEGPFEIIDIDRPNITIRDGRRSREVHMNRVKIYNEADMTEGQNNV
ncbi:unnamed protein product [Cylicocyclus nassatus]|uniref:RNA-directed DNA polymerase n=1 Tax=Cylicocyclus nassatus TaxID=53992 RepID=A0AA36GCR8_CYLNA|nr:unnamed protein product [Cylicocyclus nassatus]